MKEISEWDIITGSLTEEEREFIIKKMKEEEKRRKENEYWRIYHILENEYVKGKIKTIKLDNIELDLSRMSIEYEYETYGNLYDLVIKKKSYIVSLPNPLNGVNTKFIKIVDKRGQELLWGLKIPGFYFLHPDFIFVKEKGKKPKRIFSHRVGGVRIYLVVREYGSRIKLDDNLYIPLDKGKVIKRILIGDLRFHFLRQGPYNPSLRRELVKVVKGIRILKKTRRYYELIRDEEMVKYIDEVIRKYEEKRENIQNKLQPKSGAYFLIKGEFLGEKIREIVWVPSATRDYEYLNEIYIDGNQYVLIYDRSKFEKRIEKIRKRRNVRRIEVREKFTPRGVYGFLNHEFRFIETSVRKIDSNRDFMRRINKENKVVIYEYDIDKDRHWYVVPQNGDIRIIIKNKDHKNGYGRILVHLKHDKLLKFVHRL